MNTNIINWPELTRALRENGLTIQSGTKISKIVLRDLKSGKTLYEKKLPVTEDFTDTFTNDDFDLSYSLHNMELNSIKLINIPKNNLIFYLEKNGNIIFIDGKPEILLNLKKDLVD